MAEKLAAERIALALTKIERAQNLLSEAAAELSPILGMVKQWDKLCKLGDKCKENWYALDGARQKKAYRIDDLLLQFYVSAAAEGAAPQEVTS
jgi:hypothetical protein